MYGRTVIYNPDQPHSEIMIRISHECLWKAGKVDLTAIGL